MNNEVVFPVERTGCDMSNTTVLMADMGILVGIFLLGLLAKLFPKRQGTGSREQGTGNRQ